MSLYRIFMLVFLLAGLALRLVGLGEGSIWWDEARNIDVALLPLAHIAGAPVLDIHPPFYFWTLGVWSRLVPFAAGDPPQTMGFAARYLSALLGIAGIALAARLAGRVAGPAGGALAAALAASSPLWLAESQETRMYTLAFALLAGAALVLLRGLDRPAGTTLWLEARRLGPFVLLSTMALLTHYNAVFILLAWYLWWGARELLSPAGFRGLLRPLCAGLAMTLLLLPAAPIALRQIPDYRNPNIVPPPAGDFLRESWNAFLAGYGADPAALSPWAFGGAAILLLGLCLTRFFSRRGPAAGRRDLGFLLAWLLGGTLIYFLVVLERGSFHPRYGSLVTPALYALLGVAVAGLARIWRPLPLAGLALLLAGILPSTYAELTDPALAREDTAGVAAWLKDAAGPDDVIFIDQKYPFGFYYGRFTVDREAGAPPDGPEAAPAAYLFVDINTIAERLTDWAGDARRIFWVQWYESDTDPRNVVPYLLDVHGRFAGEMRFRGYVVRWWDMHPSTVFRLAGPFRELGLSFEPGVRAESLSLPAEPLEPGRPLPVVVRWSRLPGPAAGLLKARLALYDAAGLNLAQDDRRLLNDRHLAPVEWTLGSSTLNVYLLWLPADLLPGEYTLRLLVYDEATLAPFDWLDGEGVEPTVGSVPIGDAG